LVLHAQGLASRAPFGQGPAGTHRAIAHLGYVQIDTLSVMERAHHHVLWNRVPDYDLAHLNRLVGERQIFQYRYHAAAYLPMRDYRHALRRMQAIRTGETHARWTGWRCGSGCLPAHGLKRRQPGVGRRRLVHPAPSLSEAPPSIGRRSGCAAGGLSCVAAPACKGGYPQGTAWPN
jgi:hypothetical protein